MPTYKQTMRTIGKYQRQAQRNAARKQRELAARQKQLDRMHEQERAAHEVAVHENHVEMLTSVHREVSDAVPWTDMANSEAPTAPERATTHEDTARTRAETYVPRGLDKLGKRADTKRAALAAAVEEAIALDEAEHTKALEQHASAHAEWEKSHDLAGRVLQGDASAHTEAFKSLNPFEELGEIGTRVSFSSDGTRVQLTIFVHSEEVVPNEMKTLLQSGKVSTKPMPKGRYYEIYQEYVCGCVLRGAHEIFALLPVDTAIINAALDMVNPATGHLEEQVIVSVAAIRATLERLNLERTSSVRALSNFVHRMDFKKLKGFSAIEPVSFSEIEEATREPSSHD